MADPIYAMLAALAKKAAEDAGRDAGVSPGLLFHAIRCTLEAAYENGVLEVHQVGDEAGHE